MSVLPQGFQLPPYVPVLLTVFGAALLFLFFSDKGWQGYPGAKIFRPSFLVRGFVCFLFAGALARGVDAVRHPSLWTVADALFIFELLNVYPYTFAISDEGLSWRTPWSTHEVVWTAITAFQKKQKFGNEEAVILAQNGERLEITGQSYPGFDELVVTIGQQLERHHNHAAARIPVDKTRAMHMVIRALIAALVAYKLHPLFG